MEGSRLDRVHIEVAENLVEITWEERDRLLEKLRTVAGCETIIERFWAVGASLPVELNDEQRSRLRVALELWGVSVLPDGLARLLIAAAQQGRLAEGAAIAALLSEKDIARTHPLAPGTAPPTQQATSRSPIR